MIVSWKRFCNRRRTSLRDLVQQQGLTYEKLCVFFKNRQVQPPDRNEPDVVSIFGPPEPVRLQKNPVPKPEPAPNLDKKPAKVPQRFELSIKDTKARLLEVAGIIGLNVDEKLTKQKILNTLSESDKVVVRKIATSRRKANKKKK